MLKRSRRISKPTINQEKSLFSLDDLMYVHSYNNTIKSLYDFLLLYYIWSKKPTNYFNFTQLSKSHKMNSCLSSVLKSLGYANDSLKWDLPHMPTMGDAIIIQIGIRDYNRGSSQP